MADLNSVKQAITVESQIVQSANQLSGAFGGAISAGQSLGKQLNGIGGLISAEITPLQSGLAPKMGDALRSVEQSLFSPQGTPLTASQNQNLARSRQVAAQAEAAGGYAVALMHSAAISSRNASSSQVVVPATTQQLHGDMAANSLSRLKTYQSIANIHQLVAAWLSEQSSKSALLHYSAGAAGPASTPSDSRQSSSSADGEGQELAAAQTANELISLHDARVAAQALLSSYSALQQTISSAAMAQKFADDANAVLKQSVAAAGVTGMSATDIQMSLLAVDQSGWLDSGKTARSQQAAAATLAMLGLSEAGIVEQGPAVAQVYSAMSSWLDAEKQNRYWAALSGDAQRATGMLDARLGALSDKAGVDVTGISAALRERDLLTQLSGDPASSRWSKLIFAARKDPAAQSVLTLAGVQ